VTILAVLLNPARGTPACLGLRAALCWLRRTLPRRAQGANEPWPVSFATGDDEPSRAPKLETALERAYPLSARCSDRRRSGRR
jgi:hypothetical protein